MSHRSETDSTRLTFRAVPVPLPDSKPTIPEVLAADSSTELPCALPVHRDEAMEALAVGQDEPIEALPAIVDLAERPVSATKSPQTPWLERAFWAFLGVPEWLLGVATLTIGLAMLAAIPVLQFLSLGYMLEAGGRVARTGRLRDGFIGVRLAARLGGIVFVSWLLLWLVRFVAGMAHSAEMIDPGSRAAAGWRIGLYVLIGVVFFHIAMACARGGRLRYFINPFNFVWVILDIARGNYYVRSRDAVWDTVMSLRLPFYFWLGFRGFVGAMAWLVIPVSLLAVGRLHGPLASLIGVLGAISLAIVLVYLPFLQMRLAMTNRLRGAFELLTVRRDFRRAPWAFAFSFVVTLLFALPLYLFKIEIVPREAEWIPGLVFVMFIFPARLMVGWAMGRAVHRAAPRHWFFRWTGRLPFLPAAAFYVLIVFFTQYTSWNGIWSLYEQHAFLVPVPFLGM